MGGCLKIVFECLAHRVTVCFALGSSWQCSRGPELCSGAETPSSFLLKGLVSLRAFLQGSFANPGTDGCRAKAGRCFWRSCSLTSALSSPIQLKVARAVGSSRGDLPKCGPSGRANTTTSRAATSTRTRSPARPRCSR